MAKRAPSSGGGPAAGQDDDLQRRMAEAKDESDKAAAQRPRVSIMHLVMHGVRSRLRGARATR